MCSLKIELFDNKKKNFLNILVYKSKRVKYPDDGSKGELHPSSISHWFFSISRRSAIFFIQKSAPTSIFYNESWRNLDLYATFVFRVQNNLRSKSVWNTRSHICLHVHLCKAASTREAFEWAAPTNNRQFLARCVCDYCIDFYIFIDLVTYLTANIFLY